MGAGARGYRPMSSLLTLRRPRTAHSELVLPSIGATRRHGSTASIEIWSAAGSGRAAEATAELLLARCESDLHTMCDVFDVSPKTVRPILVVLTPMTEATPAVHDGQLVHCDIAPAAGDQMQQALYSCYLVAAQLVEIVAATQARGWEGSSAHGEAFSRLLAAGLYPRWHNEFATGTAWLSGERPDAVNARVPGDGDDQGIGCAELFLNYLHHELDVDWRTIGRAGAPTLATTYRRVTGALDDPFPAFFDALRDVTDAADGNLGNPFPRPKPAPAISAEQPDPVDAGPSTVTVAGHAATEAVVSPTLALTDVLTHRRWWVLDTPVRHIRAEQVFVPEVYDGIVTTFRERKERGDLTRSLPGYDASAASVTHDNAGGLSVFLTRAWHDLIAGMLGVQASGEVIATLHHHAPGSASGSMHNDLNPGWFPKRDGSSDHEVSVHDPAVNDYRTGVSPGGVPTIERTRAISLLYYLDTPEEVQGGGTGFYCDRRQAVNLPDVLVPPRNNSLVAFECTPFSFHTFISNVGRERNCLAMWLHRDRSDTVALWGAGSIVGW